MTSGCWQDTSPRPARIPGRIKIKDGDLNNVATLLDRLATLATQSASGSTTDAIRTTLQKEATAVVAETRFNILQQSGIAAPRSGEPDVGVSAVTAPVSA
jgi:hypothetical protein